MKTGIELQELAVEVKRQSEARQDYVAETNGLEAFIPINDSPIAIRFKDETVDNESPAMQTGFGLTDNAHSQVSQRLEIPKRYYDRMLIKQPALLCRNINTWFEQEAEKRMLRTLDGNIRAFLSNKYRQLDNYELMNAILPVLSKYPDCKIESCQVTENHLYIKAILHEMTGELKNGDVVKSGVVISNSETGQGSLKVEPLTYILSCTNGMISARSIKKYHVGSAQGTEDAVWEVLSSETKKMTDEAFWNQTKDVVISAFDEADFNTRIEEINEAQDHTLSPRKLTGVVTAIQKKHGLSDEQHEDVMTRLIADGDLSRWGVAQAITRTAQDQEDYEDATSLERIGGLITESSSDSFDSMVKQLSKKK